MITKRQMLELLQNRLNGGDAPQDVRRLYSLSIIARIVNFAFSGVVTTNSDAAADMAIPYTFTPTSDTNGYYITLNPRPIAGSLAIFSVEDDSTDYFVQDKNMNKSLSVLKGTSGNKNAAVLVGDKLRLHKTPSGDVVVTMVPNIYSMADDDMLLAPMSAENQPGELDIFRLCLQVLKTPELQDDLNNNSIDSQNGRTR